MLSVKALNMLFEILCGPRGGKVYLRDGANYFLRLNNTYGNIIYLECTQKECKGTARIDGNEIRELERHTFDHYSNTEFPNDILELRFLKSLRELCSSPYVQGNKEIFENLFET